MQRYKNDYHGPWPAETHNLPKKTMKTDNFSINIVNRYIIYKCYHGNLQYIVAMESTDPGARLSRVQILASTFNRCVIFSDSCNVTLPQFPH